MPTLYLPPFPFSSMIPYIIQLQLQHPSLPNPSLHITLPPSLEHLTQHLWNTLDLPKLFWIQHEIGEYAFEEKFGVSGEFKIFGGGMAMGMRVLVTHELLVRFVEETMKVMGREFVEKAMRRRVVEEEIMEQEAMEQEVTEEVMDENYDNNEQDEEEEEEEYDAELGYSGIRSTSPVDSITSSTSQDTIYPPTNTHSSAAMHNFIQTQADIYNRSHSRASSHSSDDTIRPPRTPSSQIPIFRLANLFVVFDSGNEGEDPYDRGKVSVDEVNILGCGDGYLKFLFMKMKMRGWRDWFRAEWKVVRD